ncbi:hypothetical protein LUZ60_009891 [Juncus effusus]|nr:hypothetical protein LUZ60_009891 [Juncus effusus]
MHSAAQRANAIATFGVALLATLCVAASILDAFNTPDVQARVQVTKINRFRRQLDGNDEVRLTLNMSMNLESLFTWNTKQVFVFLAAEYETPKNGLNQVSLWDHIIQDKEKANFNIKVPTEYPLIDQGSNLRGKEIDLVLHWHIMPKSGRMIRDKMKLSSFSLPNSYTNKI